jgi:broad specificity phosphatase PhoE
MRTVRILPVLLVLALLLPAIVHAQSATIVLVRHAEKVDESADPPLSAAGVRRAEALATALSHADVRGVYITQYQRTRATALPLAAAAHLEPVVVDAISGNAPAHAERVAARIRADVPGGTVLVVGHSNTVPAIIAALGGPDVGLIGDDDYHDFFVLQLDGTGARLIRARY